MAEKFVVKMFPQLLFHESPMVGKSSFFIACLFFWWVAVLSMVSFYRAKAFFKCQISTLLEAYPY